MESLQEKMGIPHGEVNSSPAGRVTLNEIPTHFLEWLASSRIRFLNDLKDGKPLRYFSAHLPVMSTWNSDSPFPVNMTVKGIGLIPKAEYLDDYSDIFEGVIAESRTKPWQESFNGRIDAMNRLYGDMQNFDPTMLGGLEIFEGKAFENLRGNPYASLLYVGMAYNPPSPPLEKGGKGGFETVQYTSFQVNGKVEILGKDSPYYRFLLAARKLFEFDRFHLYQPDYPFGYLIRVLEVKDKSPWSRSRKT